MHDRSWDRFVLEKKMCMPEMIPCKIMETLNLEERDIARLSVIKRDEQHVLKIYSIIKIEEN
jgi:hypothetical protein